MMIGLAELTAALRRGAAVHGYFCHSTIADVLDIGGVQSQEPPATFTIALWKIGQHVRAGLFPIPTAAHRANLDGVIITQLNVGIVLGSLD